VLPNGPINLQVFLNTEERKAEKPIAPPSLKKEAQKKVSTKQSAVNLLRSLSKLNLNLLSIGMEGENQAESASSNRNPKPDAESPEQSPREAPLSKQRTLKRTFTKGSQKSPAKSESSSESDDIEKWA
jgi:hypothetical protein